MIDDIEAEEYYFVGHANYEELGYQPEVNHKKLTHFIGVSQFSTDKLDEWCQRLGVNKKTIRCYNPLTLEPKEKVLRLVSAGRLDDKVKGGERTLRLIEALDRYCEKTGRHYIWTIFSNPVKMNIKSPNVALMKPRVDVRPYIPDADYVLQLSNDMETYCYTINEALGYGVPIVTTPLTILDELPITDNEHLVLDWNCNNADEIARQIFEKEVKPFEYIPPEDKWNKLLAEGKSIYKEEQKMKYLVEATNKYEKTGNWDNTLSEQKKVDKYIPKQGERWKVDFERKEKLVELGYVKVVKEIKEIETAKKEIKTEKAVKKVTKTAKKTTTKKSK